MKEGQEKSKKCSKGAEKTEVNTFLFGTLRLHAQGFQIRLSQVFKGLSLVC